MHDNLAWAVLGVQPSVSAAIESAAKERCIPTGQFLEQLMAEAQEAVHEKAASMAAFQQRNQRLSNLISNMADALMAAADVVEEPSGAQRAVRSVTSEPLKCEPTASRLQGPAEPEIQPQASASEEIVSSSPNADKLQAWLRISDEKMLVPIRPKLFGRGRLRLSA